MSDACISWERLEGFEKDLREKGRDMTQSYDKSPYTYRKNPKSIVGT